MIRKQLSKNRYRKRNLKFLLFLLPYLFIVYAAYAQKSMILNYSSKKVAKDIFPFLSDMEKFAEVHPVVYKIEKLQEHEYLFYEKIRFLFIPFNFSYKVLIEDVEFNSHITMNSPVKKRIYLHLEFFLKPDKDNNTLIEENVSIEAPIIIKQIFGRTIKKVHEKLFENIEMK